MTFKRLESPMGTKDTALGKFLIFASSEGPKLLFQYLFLTIICKIYKTVSRIVLLRKVSNPDYRISSNKHWGKKTILMRKPFHFLFQNKNFNINFHYQ